MFVFMLVLAVSGRPAVVIVIVHIYDLLFHDDLLFHLHRFGLAGLGCDGGTGCPAEATANDRALTPAHRGADRGPCSAANRSTDDGPAVDLACLSDCGPSYHYNRRQFRHYVHEISFLS
jgi:hypothetical protein